MANMNDQVQRAIRESGRTMYALAKESGISKSMLSRFMSGERGLTLDSLQKIAPLIGLSIKVERPKRKGR